MASLIATPAQIRHAGGSFYGGNPEILARGVSDRVNAVFGMLFLGVGFAIQVVGYALILGTDASVSGSTARALVAVAFAIVTGLAVWVVERMTRPRRVRGPAIAVARLAQVENPEGGFDWVTQADPDGRMLRVLGQRLLHDSGRGGESDQHYARRVWDVERVRED